MLRRLTVHPAHAVEGAAPSAENNQPGSDTAIGGRIVFQLCLFVWHVTGSTRQLRLIGYWLQLVTDTVNDIEIAASWCRFVVRHALLV